MSELLHNLNKAMSAGRWLIALDRDGTLVPYAERPEEAIVDDALAALMNELDKQPGFDVAIISARSVAQLRGDFDDARLILAGNYGMEVRFPDGRMAVQPQALRSVSYLKMVRDELARRLDLNAGAILEDHGYSLCLHWHMVQPDHLSELHEAVRSVSRDFSGVRFRALPTSYEMLPNIPWDKGLALEFLSGQLAEYGQDWFYFYAGDSEADTPAFLWVAQRGGISIRVGGTGSIGAQFHLARPQDLHALLHYLAQKRSARSVA